MGRSIEEVIIDDPAYLQRLAGQDGSAASADPAPGDYQSRQRARRDAEHNALQVRLLDGNFCPRFVSRVMPIVMQKNKRGLDGSRRVKLEADHREKPL